MKLSIIIPVYNEEQSVNRDMAVIFDFVYPKNLGIISNCSGLDVTVIKL